MYICVPEANRLASPKPSKQYTNPTVDSKLPSAPVRLSLSTLECLRGKTLIVSLDNVPETI